MRLNPGSDQWIGERRDDARRKMCVWTSTKSVENMDLLLEWDDGLDVSTDRLKLAANQTDASTLLHYHNAILQDVDEFLQREWSNRTARIPAMEDDAAILRRIDQQHDLDCAVAVCDDASLAMEPLLSNSTTIAPSFEWVFLSGNRSKVVQSKAPLLNATLRQGIRQSAEEIWSRGNTSSRFTYQFQSNYEVHVSDVLSRNASLRNQFNDALIRNIYPLLRRTLLPRHDAHEQLFVYDALIIRYNASTAGSTRPAGQPQHRDYGLATVNVLLNDPEEFHYSGGTFLEEQLSTENDTNPVKEVVRPLHPHGVGYGLAHWASQRHAGAGITRGIREILVVFVTSTLPTVVDGLPSEWPKVAPNYRNTIRNTQLKQCRQYCEERYPDDLVAVLECRIRHQRLAMLSEPSDGEAVQYLGTALMHCAMSNGAMSAASLLRLAIRCFALASALTPCDHRVYNNWGIAQSRLRDLLAMGPLNPEDAFYLGPKHIDQSYQRALELLEQSMAAMGRVNSLEEAWASTALNFGLELANREAWVDAVQVLERIPFDKSVDDAFRINCAGNKDTTPSAPEQVLCDAYKLWQFCKIQIEPSSSYWNI
jgi:hypothetical protein